jgi:demethylmenaquinone methyltransferase / 2-methoxy-6-polyprenyl-1,4-benzoquinol methylase
MFDVVAPRYDLINKVISLGLDSGWRRKTLRLLGLAPSSLLADLGCGTGDLARALAGAGQRVVGLDLSPGMLAAAVTAGTAEPLVLADASVLPLRSGALDGAVSGFALRNFTDLGAVFSELARTIRPLGRLSLLEVDSPSNAVLRSGHQVWFNHAVPRIGGLLSDPSAYRYLPRSVAYLPPRGELDALIVAAGFRDVVHHPLSGGLAQVITATRDRSLDRPAGA